MCAIGLAWGQILPVRAQPVFETVNRASGLPSDYINSIYQDRFGFLWFGTDAGLARYDGQQVETFTADDGLPHPFVYDIQEDGSGTLWVGTFRGLAHFDGTRFLSSDQPFGSLLIGGLEVDEAGHLLVRTEEGMARREGDRWRIARGTRGRLSESWGGIVALADGRLVGGGVDDDGRGTLFAFTPQGDGFEVVDLAPSFRSSARYRIGDAGNGQLFVYSNAANGHVRRIQIRGNRVAVLDSVAVGNTRLLVPDKSGGAVLFRESGREGVYRLTPDLRLGEAPIHPGPTQTLMVDYEGSLWIGTFGNGAFRLQSEALRTLADTPASRLALGPEGDVWATGNGLWRVDPATQSVSTVLRQDGLREIHFSDTDELWVSSGPSLNRGGRRLGRTLSPFRQDPGWVSGVDVAGDTVRMSSYSGGILRVVAGQDVDTLREGRGVTTDMIEGLKRTSGSLWAITRSHGAYRLSGSRAIPFGREQGLPSSAVFSVFRASDGTTWFGTDRGVARLTPGRNLAVPMGEDVLRGQRVMALFERDGHIWIVGDRSLYRVRQDSVEPTGSGSILPDPQMSINDALYHAASDQLVLATSRGLVAVELAKLPEGTSPSPRIAIRGMRYEDTSVSLLGSVLAAQTAPIPPGRHRIEVEFAPLSFTGPVRTEVRLNNGEWRDVGTERRVVFPELGSGTYRLEVRAISPTGQVSERSASLAFSVEPHWWQRPAVVALFVLLGLALLVLGVRDISQRRLRAQIRQLEVERRLHDERERISRDLHDHVGAQLSSLLAGVELARLKRSASGDGAPPDLQAETPDPLDGVEADARTTMRQLRETIWALHGASVSMDEFASRVRSDLAARRTQLETQVTCSEGRENALSPVQALNLFRITQEAITNAIKHAGACTIEVTLEHRGSTVSVEVQDDGMFRETSGGDGASSLHGFGLRSMEARAQQLGGELVIDTSRGTRVRVVVPAEAADVA